MFLFSPMAFLRAQAAIRNDLFFEYSLSHQCSLLILNSLSQPSRDYVLQKAWWNKLQNVIQIRM